MEHALSTALGRRCGSAAYLSDAGITSSSWLHPYSLIIILSTQHTQFPNSFSKLFKLDFSNYEYPTYPGR
jgi:hypothetical protein